MAIVTAPNKQAQLLVVVTRGCKAWMDDNVTTRWTTDDDTGCPAIILNAYSCNELVEEMIMDDLVEGVDFIVKGL